MIGKRARERFMGQYGKRVGCAQAVAASFLEAESLEGFPVESFLNVSGGRAPLGYCGAVHAALTIAGKALPHKVPEIKDFFISNAGGLTCKEIRARKKMTCADCVERAAEFLRRERPSDVTVGPGE